MAARESVHGRRWRSDFLLCSGRSSGLSPADQADWKVVRAGWMEWGHQEDGPKDAHVGPVGSGLEVPGALCTVGVRWLESQGLLPGSGVLSLAKAEAVCSDAGAQLWGRRRSLSRLSQSLVHQIACASLLYASEAADGRKITFCLVYSGGQLKSQRLSSISLCVTMEKTVTK